MIDLASHILGDALVRAARAKGHDPVDIFVATLEDVEASTRQVGGIGPRRTTPALFQRREDYLQSHVSDLFELLGRRNPAVRSFDHLRREAQAILDRPAKRPQPPKLRAVTAQAAGPRIPRKSVFIVNLAAAPASGPPTPSTDADTVRVRYRLISAVVAWPLIDGFDKPIAIDYGANNAQALRDLPSIINSGPRPPKLVWGHSDEIGAVCGLVRNATWEESYDVPSGVNADLEVRRSYDPKAADGLASGLLDAVSISVRTELTPSHPDMPMPEFLRRQGELVDGLTVAMQPTRILECPHVALVQRGADDLAGPRYATGGRP